MPSSFARLIDPTFEDEADPFGGYDPTGEPLDDRLYLPCGIDPQRDVCGVAFVHPRSHRQDILETRLIDNHCPNDLDWLIDTGRRLAPQFGAQPVYVFEATGPFWQAYRYRLHQHGLATATVCGRQTKHARAATFGPQDQGGSARRG